MAELVFQHAAQRREQSFRFAGAEQLHQRAAFAEVLGQGAGQLRVVAADLAAQQLLQFAVAADQPFHAFVETPALRIEIFTQLRADALVHVLGVVLQLVVDGAEQAGGFALDEGSFATNDILEVGPGGHFLTTDLTLQRFREAHYQSEIWPHLTFTEWQAEGQPRPENLVRAHTRRLMEELRAPEDHEELMARGEAFIKRRIG